MVIILPEKTEVVCGTEQVVRCYLDFLSKSKLWINTCGDANAPSVIIALKEYNDPLLECKKRGLKLRYVTEVTKQNLQYSKELAKIVELKHLDGIKGNFAVTESQYLGVGNLQETMPVSLFIYSNVKAIVELQQFLFETLWNKAIPAEQRIIEIEEGILRPETKVLEAPTEIYNRIAKTIEDSNELMIATNSDALDLAKNYFLDIFKTLIAKQKRSEHKGVRWALFIDRESINSVKFFLDIGVLIRHVKNMPAMNFGLSDKIFDATIEEMEGGKMIQTLLTSTERLYVKHFKSIFEELWGEGVDAEERIKDLETGVDAETEIVINPRRTEQIYKEILHSARKNIMLLLPTISAFKGQEKMEMISALEQSARLGTLVKVLLTSFRSESLAEADMINDLRLRGIEAHAFSRTVREGGEDTINVIVLIADDKKAMVIEMRDDSKDSFMEEIGPAFVSTQKSLVSSYSGVFESLWLETGLIARLEESDRLQREFINLAAHELRTPITPILALTGLAERIVGIDGDATVTLSEANFDMIIRNAKRLERLALDILDVAKIETGAFKLNKVKIDLNMAIRDIVKGAQGFVPNDKDIDIAFESYNAGSNLMVEADESRLYEVMTNLLTNAVHFTPLDGAITVSINKSAEGKEVIIFVRDTGMGIQPEMMPHLFQKFRSGNSSLVLGGTGLGLYISKKIIEAHGGKIWAKNNSGGKGATFAFTLPLAKPS